MSRDSSFMSGVVELSNISCLDETEGSINRSTRTSQRKRKQPKADLDTPRLISLVQEYHCIWDEEDEEHRDLNSVSQAWESIAKEFYDATAAECLKQWTGVLKSYRQNLNRHSKTMRGSGLTGGRRQRPYKYSKQLSFLKRVGNLSDEIVQGPSLSKGKIHTSSPIRTDKEYGSKHPSDVAFSFGLGESPLRVNNSQKSENLFLLRHDSTPPLCDKQENNNRRKSFSKPRLPSIKEESENSQSLSGTDLNKDQSSDKQPPIKILKSLSSTNYSKNNQSSDRNPPTKKLKTDAKVTAAKMQVKKREEQCDRISQQVKQEMQMKKYFKESQNVNKPVLKKEEENLNEKEIVEKLLGEEDRFMYSVLSLVQPLRALPLPKARKVLLGITNLVFEAEEEAESEAKVKAQAQAEAEVEGGKLSKTLTEEDQDLIDLYLKASADSAIPDTLFNFTILVVDLQSLKPKEFLNDRVINYYLAILSSESKKSTCALSTFFFLDMTTKGYDAAKKHTQRLDIFSYELMLVPIHKDSNHWVLAVIDLVKRNIRYYDSMNGQYIHCPSVLLQFLEAEHQNRKNSKLESFLWSSQHMTVPKQQNGFDCGVFVCKYAECETRGIPVTFSQADMSNFRKEIMVSIIKGEIVSHLK